MNWQNSSKGLLVSQELAVLGSRESGQPGSQGIPGVLYFFYLFLEHIKWSHLLQILKNGNFEKKCVFKSMMEKKIKIIAL